MISKGKCFGQLKLATLCIGAAPQLNPPKASDYHSLQALATGVTSSRTVTEASTTAANTSSTALALPGSNFPATPVKNRTEASSTVNKTYLSDVWFATFAKRV